MNLDLDPLYAGLSDDPMAWAAQMVAREAGDVSREELVQFYGARSTAFNLLRDYRAAFEDRRRVMDLEQFLELKVLHAQGAARLLIADLKEPGEGVALLNQLLGGAQQLVPADRGILLPYRAVAMACLGQAGAFEELLAGLHLQLAGGLKQPDLSAVELWLACGIPFAEDQIRELKSVGAKFAAPPEFSVDLIVYRNGQGFEMVKEMFYAALDSLIDEERTPEQLTGEELRSVNGMGETLPHWLLVEGRVDLAERLVQLGAPLSSEGAGCFVLHDCLTARQLSSVRFLLSEGLDPNSRGRHGCSCFQSLAAVEDCEPYIELLLQHGASVELASEALSKFVLFGNVRGAEVLLARGADPNHRDPGDDSTPLHKVRHIEDGETRAAMIKVLLDAGADRSITNIVDKAPEL